MNGYMWHEPSVFVFSKVFMYVSLYAYIYVYEKNVVVFVFHFKRGKSNY